MENIKFTDYNEQKYQRIENFHEGLAAVQDSKTYLWGFINKKGEEVISPRYQYVKEFSEGLAAVQDTETHLWGFIDKTGKLVIRHKYLDTQWFSEGYVAVKQNNMTWVYIDKYDKKLPTEEFKLACDFSDGYAVVQRTRNPYNVSFIDKIGNIRATYCSASSFKNGLTVVINGQRYLVLNTKFEIVGKANEKEFGYIEGNSEGFFLAKFNDGEYGYLNEQLKEVNIPSFKNCNHFSDGMARIELSPMWKGYVSKEGKIMIFSTNQHYEGFGDFNEGLASVQSTSSYLYGFINKNGEEVIKCEYEEVENFSEGLASVTDCEGVHHYIDKNGNKKITIPTKYHSALQLDDKTIIISANSKEELAHKKLQLLSILKTEMINEFIKSIDQVAYDETSELTGNNYSRAKK